MEKKFKAGLPSEILPSMIDSFDITNNDRIIDYFVALCTPASELGDADKVLVSKRTQQVCTVEEMIKDLKQISKQGKNIPVYMMYTGHSKIKTIPSKVYYDTRGAAVICDGHQYSDPFKVSKEEYHTNNVKCAALEIIKKYKLIKLMEIAVNRTADVMGDGMPSLHDIVASKPTWIDPKRIAPDTFEKLINYLNEALSDGPTTNTVTAQINSIQLIKNSKKTGSTLVFEYTVKNTCEKE